MKLRTYTLKQRDMERDWHVIDAAGVPLGRLATNVACLLRGKHKPTFSPHLDMGDGVIVVNAARVGLTGAKLDKKRYLRWTGWMGGQRSTPLKTLMVKSPDKVVREAVWGMLPKNKLSRHVLTHLRVYAGAEHPHAAQQPHSYQVR